MVVEFVVRVPASHFEELIAVGLLRQNGHLSCVCEWDGRSMNPFEWGSPLEVTVLANCPTCHGFGQMYRALAKAKGVVHPRGSDGQTCQTCNGSGRSDTEGHVAQLTAEALVQTLQEFCDPEHHSHLDWQDFCQGSVEAESADVIIAHACGVNDE